VKRHVVARGARDEEAIPSAEADIARHPASGNHCETQSRREPAAMPKLEFLRMYHLVRRWSKVVCDRSLISCPDDLNGLLD